MQFTNLQRSTKIIQVISSIVNEVAILKTTYFTTHSCQLFLDVFTKKCSVYTYVPHKIYT